MRTVAERLFVLEAKGKQSRATSDPTVLLVCERLRPELASLVGDTGVQALFTRSLVLASAQVAWLRALRVGADGRLQGFEGSEVPVEPDQVSAGGVVMLAELLELLAAFIGEPLTLRIMQEKWPRLALKDLDRNKRN